jgi:hypothetical protein
VVKNVMNLREHSAKAESARKETFPEIASRVKTCDGGPLLRLGTTSILTETPLTKVVSNTISRPSV